DFVDLLPEIVNTPPRSAARLPPMIVRKLAGHERRCLDDRECFVRFAVDELRSELDREREISDVQRVNASAGAGPRLQNADAFSGAGELTCSREAGDTGADDDGVKLHGEMEDCSLCAEADYSPTISRQGSRRTATTFSSISTCVAFSPRTRRRYSTSVETSRLCFGRSRTAAFWRFRSETVMSLGVLLILIVSLMSTNT